MQKVILTLIILLATYLRLSDLGLMEFKYDEAMVSVLTVDLVKGHVFPQVGIMSSVGLHNPPLFIYIMAIPFSLFKTSSQERVGN